jgi:hypothetical protein
MTLAGLTVQTSGVAANGVRSSETRTTIALFLQVRPPFARATAVGRIDSKKALR